MLNKLLLYGRMVYLGGETGPWWHLNHTRTSSRNNLIDVMRWVQGVIALQGLPPFHPPRELAGVKRDRRWESSTGNGSNNGNSENSDTMPTGRNREMNHGSTRKLTQGQTMVLPRVRAHRRLCIEIQDYYWSLISHDLPWRHGMKD